MAINFPNGFNITSQEPVDARIVLTKEQMAATKKARMPQVYFAVCSDDNQIYIFNANNEADPTTGRFRPLLAGVEGDIATLQAAVQQLNADLANKQDKLTAGSNITIEQDSEGNWVISSTGGGMDPEQLALELPGALRKALARQEANSGLMVDSEGNIVVSLDSDFLKIDENNHITFSDFIIESGE